MPGNTIVLTCLLSISLYCLYPAIVHMTLLFIVLIVSCYILPRLVFTVAPFYPVSANRSSSLLATLTWLGAFLLILGIITLVGPLPPCNSHLYMTCVLCISMLYDFGSSAYTT